jgi:predicted MFS family arabinose efflux permease
MVAMGETFLVAYSLSLGIHERNAAFVGTLPVVFGSILQILVFRRVRALVSARKWVVICAAVQSLVLFCLPVARILGDFTYSYLVIAGTVYWTAGFSAGPVWNGWVTSILPFDRQKSFFYRRNAISQLAILTGIVLAGIILKQLQVGYFGFPAIFILAGFFRLGSSYCLAKQPDAVNYAFAKISSGGDRLRQLVRRPFVVHALLFSFFTNFAVFLSAPFFSPYMLKKLALGPTDYSILIASGFFARSVSGYILERLLQVKQNQAIFKIGVLGIILVPLLWTFSDRYSYLIVLQILSGFFWGCHELGMTMMLIEKIENESRLRILTLTNLIASLGIFAGCMAGWVFAGSDTIPKETYHSLFAASSLFRLIPVVFLLPYIRLADSWQPSFRTLGVRPAGQGILKPIIVEDSETI